MWAATSRAAARSGEPSRPTAKLCRRGHQAGVFSSSSIRPAAWRAARAATTDESSPPEMSTP